MALVISGIYNTSLRQGIFPEIIKRSHVVPIPKVAPPKSMEEDLHPISLTAQSFVLKSLLSEVADKLDKNQFALTAKSTTQALVYFIHLIHPGLDKGNSSSRLFFCCLPKGFWLVDHNVIISELGNLGVQLVIIRCIRSFLTDCEQCVQIDSCKSSWKKVNGGIPQGTKLGPLLFAILINSLLIHWQDRVKFVDDSFLVFLLVAVKDIAEFGASRGIELNPKKCKELILSFLKYDLTRANSIYLGIASGKSFPVINFWGLKSLKTLLGTFMSTIFKKANSRHHALRQLKNAGLTRKILYTPIARSCEPAWNMRPLYGPAFLITCQSWSNPLKKEL